jgi:hypothetical protein
LGSKTITARSALFCAISLSFSSAYAAEDLAATQSSSSSAIQSITGSGSPVRSITGSGSPVRSITGSGSPVRSIDGSADTQPDVIVFGSLDGIGEGRINVLGQDFDTTSLSVDEEDLQIGRLVYLEATVSDTEGLPTARKLEIFETLSIPGVTTVFVQGAVSSIDSSVGRISIGALEIDVNTATGPSVELGQTINVAGTQPAPRGLILGTARQ